MQKSILKCDRISLNHDYIHTIYTILFIAGSEAMEKETVEEISKEVVKTKDLPMKKVTMQVKPHLLYVPSLSKMTTKAPDYNANYQLFDRVVVAKETEKYSTGMRGTVIGINRVKDLNPVRQDCVNKEDVYCEILFDDLNGNNKTGRLLTEYLVNISFGISLTGTERFPNNYKIEIASNENNKSKSNKQTETRPKLAESFSGIVKSSGPQKNQDFTKIWNALKAGDPVTLPETRTMALTSTPEKNGKMDKNEIEAEVGDTKVILEPQTKLSEAINKKVAEMTVNDGKKRSSPVSNDQAIPIIFNPPTKLPSPPAEWLSSNDSNSETLPFVRFDKSSQKLEMSQPKQQQVPFNQPPNPFLGNTVRPQQFMPQVGFLHPVPVYPPQRVRMIHQVPMMNPPPIVMPQQQTFFRNNDAVVGTYFPNNQIMRQQLPQQRFYQSNSSNNIISNPNNSNRRFRQNQPQPASAPISQNNPQPNPFIPLQAARKSTKGKDEPTSSQQGSKEATPKPEESKKVENVRETVEMPVIPSPSQTTPNETKREFQTSAKTVDPRKSRLAIKF